MKKAGLTIGCGVISMLMERLNSQLPGKESVVSAVIHRLAILSICS